MGIRLGMACAISEDRAKDCERDGGSISRCCDRIRRAREAGSARMSDSPLCRGYGECEAT